MLSPIQATLSALFQNPVPMDKCFSAKPAKEDAIKTANKRGLNGFLQVTAGC